jgi:hypothetical protein
MTERTVKKDDRIGIATGTMTMTTMMMTTIETGGVGGIETAMMTTTGG